MTTRYEATGFSKQADEQVFESGGIGTTFFRGGLSFSGDSPTAVVEQVRAFFGADPEDLMLDYGGDLGRLDVQVMETDDSSAPTADDLANWRVGTRRLWRAYYTFHVERVSRDPVQLDPADMCSAS